jgi:hypothetical protein
MKVLVQILFWPLGGVMGWAEYIFRMQNYAINHSFLAGGDGAGAKGLNVNAVNRPDCVVL